MHGTDMLQGMAYWCDHGWYPRTISTRKTSPKRPAGAYPERRNYSKVPPGYQTMSHICAGAVATGRSAAVDGMNLSIPFDFSRRDIAFRSP